MEVSVNAFPLHDCLGMGEFDSERFGTDKSFPKLLVVISQFQNLVKFEACRWLGDSVADLRNSNC